jgi:hypothetical protein
MKDRKRQIDPNNLKEEQLESISVLLGNKISEILNKAINDANAVANIYGLQVKIGYEIVPKDKE